MRQVEVNWRGGGRSLSLPRGVPLSIQASRFFPIGFRQAAVVGELAVLRVGVPRRHALLGHDFLDGLGPGAGVIVSQQRHRANLTGAVTLLAMLLQNAADVPGIGDGSFLPGWSHAIDDTARHRGSGNCDRLALEQFLDGLGQITAGRLVPLDSYAVLIVDAALVANDTSAIEQNRFGRPAGSELVRDFVAQVVQHREGDLMFPGMGGDTLRRVLTIGVDGHKLDAFGGKFLVQLVQSVQEEVVNGAFGADEYQDDCLLLLELGQGNCLTLSVLQGEIRGGFTLLSARRVGVQEQQNAAENAADQQGTSPYCHGGIPLSRWPGRSP